MKSFATVLVLFFSLHASAELKTFDTIGFFGANPASATKMYIGFTSNMLDTHFDIDLFGPGQLQDASDCFDMAKSAPHLNYVLMVNVSENTNPLVKRVNSLSCQRFDSDFASKWQELTGREIVRPIEMENQIRDLTREPHLGPLPPRDLTREPHLGPLAPRDLTREPHLD